MKVGGSKGLPWCDNLPLATILKLPLLGVLFLRAASSHMVTTEFDVAVSMRDHVVLRADIYRPAEKGRFPVLLERTPYDKRTGAAFGIRAAAAGYVVIIQDVRGRFASDGDWYPFRHESEDGFDTVEWAGSLAYSDSRVGMFGGSYVGATQLLAAIKQPSHLAGICPAVTPSNYHDGWVYQSGAFDQWFNQSWTAELAQETLNRKVRLATNAKLEIWKLPLASYELFNSVGNTLRLDSPEELAPYFLDWLAHPSYDDYWKKWTVEEHYPDITVPSLHITAWYDMFLGGSLRNYLGIRERGGNARARSGQRLVIAVGGHAGRGRKIGEVDFGPAAAEFNTDALILEWYDYLFKGVSNSFAKKPVKFFVMGLNKWREEDDWPPARAQNIKYFLHSARGASSLRGDGLLSTEIPESEPADRYLYDPDNPTPTIGGPLYRDDGEHLPAGPRDQRPVEAREDVLVYSTAPFTESREITGSVRVELYASSSAVDTDFTAKLVDVWPSGFAQNLTEGIVRARYRNSPEKPEALNPGQVYKFDIDMWATSNIFLRGHRLRLEIASSNFPRFDRNLNTGINDRSENRHAVAVNKIHHDSEHPSLVVLPVIAAR